MSLASQHLNTQTPGTSLIIKGSGSAGSGAIQIGADAAQTGSIDIGTGGNANITLNSGEGKLSLYGDVVEVLGGTGAGDGIIIGDPFTDTPITINSAASGTTIASTGAIAIGNNQTTASLSIGTETSRSGLLEIGTGTARTGSIAIGNVNSSGNVTVTSGTGTLTLNSLGQTFLCATSTRTNTLQIGNSGAPGNLNINGGTGTTAINGGASGTLNIGITTTTGTINAFTQSTTGPVNILTSANRSSAAVIGNASATGSLTIQNGDGATTYNGGAGGVLNVGITTTTGTVNAFTQVTSGATNILTSASRTGPATIGSSAASGNLTVSGGTGTTSFISGASGTLNVGTTNTTGNINIGTAQTSGNLNIGTNGFRTGDIFIGSVASAGRIYMRSSGDIDIVSYAAGSIALGTSPSRSGPIVIGHDSSTGTIDLAAGTGALTLRGGNWTGRAAWTPTLRAGGGAFTMTSQIGFYERQDAIVHFSLSVEYSSQNGQTGDIDISGLPFAAATTGVDGLVKFGRSTCLSMPGGTVALTGDVQDGNSTINLYRIPSGGGSTPMQHTDLASSGTLRISGWYFAA